MSVFKGSVNDDAITGTANDDVASGSIGNDTINGGAGADWIYGDLFGASQPYYAGGVRANYTPATMPLIKKGAPPELASATASTASGATTTSYTFAANAAYAFDVFYVEPGGNLKLVAAVNAGGPAGTAVLPVDGKFLIVVQETGETLDYLILWRPGAQPTQAMQVSLMRSSRQIQATL